MPMMTTKELETEYKVTRQTINNWIKKGIIPAPGDKKGHQNVWNSDQVKLIESQIQQKQNEQLSLLESEPEKLQINNRRYLGSKQKMLDFINRVVSENTNHIKTVADIFGGTGVVADMFRQQGKNIIVNDILTSNYISYQTWFGNDSVDYQKITLKINELNQLKGISGYVTENFGNRYFSSDNAQKIDAIREKINSYADVNGREKYFLLTSLLYAMDKVANTVGHFDAYRKHMDSLKQIVLRIPELHENIDNRIYNEDANQLVRKISADLVYIDTPYNSRGYESAYHVLENVMEWKKPAVEGVARKAVNRSEKSSEYTKSKAPDAFEDLVQHIDAKYILVSYNNMAKKGNSRSNAKISNEELISSLEKRGTVQVFDTDFNVFTTGKSHITNHKELLYLCTVDDSIIKSALNYTGSKHKLLPQLLPLFPTKYNRFVDLFAGGASVTANMIKFGHSATYLVNDIDKHVIDFFQHLSNVSFDSFLKDVELQIEKYGFSNTKKNGYNFYGLSSSEGLANYNKEKFLKLRSDYNMNHSPVLFYLLIVFGFNNQIRFNKNDEYNLPVGKRDFNQKMEDKLHRFMNILQNQNISFSSIDFRQIEVESDDFVYVDPPYLLTNAAYNENGGWTKKDEQDLYQYLDDINQTGAKFALSNVILHKGHENELLKKWASKYQLHVLDYHYNNSNYHSTAKLSETVEVLITNYVTGSHK